ncbi:acyl-CoA N-acyltransferase [Aspergillus steynii IBT 23096]|uniref:Acyl-CoA N-acyltransferase n=1 Tax=Aspergillus steynii IBT 23096 TaxID=1392250 RepID=A0A2I2GPG8_9EURO|nr:acyl-CoA N-acyltransferase [Aspergillus steynii IBT 23096]PLB54768.1 acyl-CoA N-acyltransferase [Aspergillus steynii IBT 23096]
MSSAIQIRYSTESDAPALGQINIDSFKHHAYWDNAFPNIDTAAIFPLKYARCLEKLTTPDVHVLSALDGDQLVGWARWQIPGSANGGVELSESAREKVAIASANVGGLLPEGANRRIYENFFTVLKDLRGSYLKEGDLTLDFLATLPESQGRGVGTKLLQWGMEIADAQDARIYLEATLDGYPLYLKHGWRPLQDLVLDFAPFGGKGTAKYIIMMRDRKSERN